MKIKNSVKKREKIKRKRTLEEVTEYVKKLPKASVGTSKSLIRDLRDSN